MKRTGKSHFTLIKTGTLKVGKLEIIYNIKTFIIDPLGVRKSNIPNSIESIKIQVALHFSRASSQLNVRFIYNAI